MRSGFEISFNAIGLSYTLIPSSYSVRLVLSFALLTFRDDGIELLSSTTSGCWSSWHFETFNDVDDDDDDSMVVDVIGSNMKVRSTRHNAWEKNCSALL